MNHTAEAIVFLDENDRVRHWSRAAEELFELHGDQFADNSIVRRAAVDCISSSERDAVRSGAVESVSKRASDQNDGHGTNFVTTVRMVHVGGQQWLYVTIKATDFHSSDQSELQRLVITDPLSQLFNRRGFQSALESNLHLRLAVAIIDVDFFKKINDELGHAAGDKAIEWISAKLQAAFGDALSIGRLGGDEFGVIAEVSTPAKITEMFVALCNDVRSDPIPWYPSGMTISIGVAVSRSANVSARDLMVTADRAMYQSKRDGRDRVTIIEI